MGSRSSDSDGQGRGLFTPVSLFDGFDPDVSGSYENTLDFQTYLRTRRSSTAAARLEWAEQDAAVTEGRDSFVGERRCIAIMGGHRVRRDSSTYASVARLARALARAGVIVTSGGGPGAMEAAHLGAAVAQRHDDTLGQAITQLARVPEFPSGMTGIVDASGVVNSELLAALHQWQAPAFALLGELAEDGTLASSLSIPTWFYGHEPPTPFATSIAKYVSNALREDGLLAIARSGVVYAPGNAGTLQEVFQDAAQNAYRTQRWFSPMCFLDVPFEGTDRWWTKRFPIETFLRPLFGDADYESYVLVSPDVDETSAFLARFTPPSIN